MSVTTTDVETIRAALVDQLERIIPRSTAYQADPWTWLDGQEIRGTLRNFDVIAPPETETERGGYGGGIQYDVPVDIVVSYPVSEQEHRRLIGSDGQDIAGMLVVLHQSVPGMFPIGYDGERIFELTIAGASGGYVATFTTTISFWASDSVAQDVA